MSLIPRKRRASWAAGRHDAQEILHAGQQGSVRATTWLTGWQIDSAASVTRHLISRFSNAQFSSSAQGGLLRLVRHLIRIESQVRRCGWLLA